MLRLLTLTVKCLSIRVDIRVTDVDEAPFFDPELTREAIIMENSTGAELQVGTYDDHDLRD